METQVKALLNLLASILPASLSSHISLPHLVASSSKLPLHRPRAGFEVYLYFQRPWSLFTFRLFEFGHSLAHHHQLTNFFIGPRSDHSLLMSVTN